MSLHIPKPLTQSQERRLVNHLDERFLDITSNFKKRNDPSSNLQTLYAYLDSARTVLALILQIPPIDPSTSLRTAYLLHLTADVLGAIPGYDILYSDLPPNVFLRNLIDFLDDLDQSWVAVLQCQIWDPESEEGIDLVIPVDVVPQSSSAIERYKSSPPSQTDITRLRSMLFSGQSSLEEWISNQRNKDHLVPDEQLEDVSLMLARMGLLDQFDSLFVRTLDYLGGYSGIVARNVLEPEMEVEMA